ncbi:calcium/sodium antiporter [Accumulibacter sp.]|uniref:calcium/sodium antiporter n=1 Tax=Accumulibacter sp. TaxID=2053492 RepID=UPI0025DDA72F|nr:calcium/sodium antiporter [Accumulibacter sp.]MCM8611613.1 calcium/sodium antiporter [Accumulibacter sp.]MCM8635378.1 calcium/sodium antiporter [Accumulibacter sp.]MCM8638983.1 calcium/sodium antiporter [Accumulibacter sp.]
MMLLLFGLGLVALIAGAQVLVRGASKLALSFGISPLVVGLTVVAFGTSAPELAVSLRSSFAGQVDIALGNVVGSNIFNVLFILGLAALISPLVVAPQLIRQEVPIMIGASLLVLALAFDGQVGRVDGGLLFGLLLGYTLFLVRQSRRESRATQAEYGAQEVLSDTAAWDRHWGVQLLLIAGGLVLLVIGAGWLVDAAVSFARILGLSEAVIGLTIVAAGTSLPEVATSLVATWRGERDIAVGNVIGSNTFNLLGVLGLSALLAPAGLPVGAAMIAFDLPVMIAVALACLPIFFSGHLIARWEGALFFAYYVAYTAWLLLAAQQHAATAAYGSVMVGFVLPLTAVTLGVIAWREWRARHGAP